MAQGRSTKIITMIKWIRTIRLSIKNSLPHTQTDPLPFEGLITLSPPVPMAQILTERGAKCDPKAKVLSLQSFLREERVVGLCWANLNLKDLKEEGGLRERRGTVSKPVHQVWQMLCECCCGHLDSTGVPRS